MGKYSKTFCFVGILMTEAGLRSEKVKKSGFFAGNRANRALAGPTIGPDFLPSSLSDLSRCA
jgi:hypothetical protein